jgi:energy-converting hydrogenase Eha subunit E
MLLPHFLPLQTVLLTIQQADGPSTQSAPVSYINREFAAIGDAYLFLSRYPLNTL